MKIAKKLTHYSLKYAEFERFEKNEENKTTKMLQVFQKGRNFAVAFHEMHR